MDIEVVICEGTILGSSILQIAGMGTLTTVPYLDNIDYDYHIFYCGIYASEPFECIYSNTLC